MEKMINDNMKLPMLIKEMKQIVERKAESTFTFGDVLTDIMLLIEMIEEEDSNMRFYWGVRKNGTFMSFNKQGIEKWIEDYAGENENPEVFIVEYVECNFSIKELIF